MQQAIMAILSGNEQSTRCAEALKKAGFSNDEISILMPDGYGAQELGFVRKTKSLEGMALGFLAGVITGMVVSLLAGESGIILRPAGQLLVGGPAVAALAFGGVFALVFGLLGALAGIAQSEFVVHKYGRKTRLCSSLIAVHAANSNEVQLVKNVFELEGAREITKSAEETIDRKPQLAAPR